MEQLHISIDKMPENYGATAQYRQHTFVATGKSVEETKQAMQTAIRETHEWLLEEGEFSNLDKVELVYTLTISALLSDCDHLRSLIQAERPLPAEALRKIEQALSIEYTYESNRIEGNTLTLQETELVVNEGITIAGKSLREHLEAINHAEAVAYIRDLVQEGAEVSEWTIKQIHALVLRGINREGAGSYRSVPVLISGSKHIPPHPYLLETEMQDFIEEYQAREKAGEHPALIAASLHERLVRIHPFVDGNGRSSRLLMNLYLLGHGYPIVILKGSDADRLRYYEALEASHTEGNSEAFQLLIAESLHSSLRNYASILGIAE